MSLRSFVFSLSILALSAGLPHAAAAEGLSWYFVGSSERQAAADLPANPVEGGFATTRSGNLDGAAGGERHQFTLRYGGTEDTGALVIGNGSGRDPYGASDVYTFYLGHSLDLGISLPVRSHVLAGVGLAYDGRSDTGTSYLGPTFELGLGASYGLGDNWAFTAEYRAFYLAGETGRTAPDEGQLFEQNFMIGAKLRF